ncbi:hypothetical protein CQW23_34460 [Capsicum baccatum]|uniref:Protein kinase domain-containing protein n=1 Tax=Capsicum baccatum TaxID=33114 RepID=A0A2G2UYW9_CAPBA|nr:hypothetical protein CQW23_34460 [Capsicum baccatum]
MSGKEPMKEDSEESPMSISEEKEPSPMSEEAESSTRTMPQGFLPQPPPPPPPPQKPSPVPRRIRGNRPPPPPPPVPSAFGHLYIRGPDGPLDDAMVKRLRLTTVCPTSLAWIIYLSAVKRAKLHFQFETSVITDDTEPRFCMDRRVFKSLEEFINIKKSLSMEPRQKEVQVALHESWIDRKSREEEQTKLREIEEKKTRMTEPLFTLESVYLCTYGLVLQSNKQWLSNALRKIKEHYRISSEKELQEYLLAEIDTACLHLCRELGAQNYYLDDLRKGFAAKPSPTAMLNLSILDAKSAASILLIMSLTGIQVVIDFSPILEANPNLLSQLHSKEPQGEGAMGKVYKVQLSNENEWQLQAGDYAFKLPKATQWNIYTESEVSILEELPYKNLLKLVGRGKGLVSNCNLKFLVTDWVPGGDLESARKDMDWDQIMRVLKSLAYAVYVVHRSGYCLCDLKPANVLLDQWGNAVLCDLAGCIESGGHIGIETGGYTNNKDGSVATWERDVFSYGMIVLQLLTGDVTKNNPGHNGFEIAKNIITRAEELTAEKEAAEENAGLAEELTAEKEAAEENAGLVKLLKEQLREQFKHMKKEKEIALGLLHLGLRCLRDRKTRVSDLEVMQHFHDIAPFDMIDSQL